MLWRRLLLGFKLIISLVLLIVIVAPEWPSFQDERYRLNALVGLREFDFLLWGARAAKVKAEALAGDGHSYLPKERRKETVLAYLDLLREAQRIQGQIDLVYADPEVPDADAATRELQRELAVARAELDRLQPVAEEILQEQVSTVLAEEGFAFLGSVWPPVKMHMTPLPLVLIVSPREEIRQMYNVPLVHGLTVPQRELLEDAVDSQLDRSSLVVPIGGMGMYPAMIIETTNINFLADVVAHEWAHHWLTLRPLGARYLENPQMRTINETVASIVGTEIGAAVIERFYPEFVPPEVPEPPATEPLPEPDPDAPPPFEFRAEMAETRIRVDQLLAEGKVEEAEAYMEERREMFVGHGYPIRKLNQAYFAFYGAYADVPGATGADPVGPTVTTVRRQSPSLYAFMQSVSRVTSFEALQALAEEAPAETGG